MTDAPPPDLSSAAGRAAYRAELRTVAAGWRRAGLVVLTAGGLGLVDHRGAPAWAAVAVGSAVLVAVIVHRTRYHRRRVTPR